MRLGVFGGSFDPVHMAHLILAEQCREQANLDRVLFVPAARPPHKPDVVLTPFHHRVEMLTLATSGHPAFVVDELEKDRPGPSFTVDTLEVLRRREPNAEMLLILGADSLVDIPRWYEPRRILELAGLLVVGRPGSPAPDVTWLRREMSLEPGFPLCVKAVTSPQIDIASRDLRRRFREGRSVRYLLPRAVEAYVAEKGLYTGT